MAKRHDLVHVSSVACGHQQVHQFAYFDKLARFYLAITVTGDSSNEITDSLLRSMGNMAKFFKAWKCIEDS